MAYMTDPGGMPVPRRRRGIPQLGAYGLDVPPPPRPVRQATPTPSGMYASRPPVVYQGGQPTLGAYQHPGNMGALDPYMAGQAHAAAVRYAQARFAQMRAVLSALPPDLQAQVLAERGAADPAAAWRAYSGNFANASRAAGYQDPRYYLRYILPSLVKRNAQNLLR